MFSTLASTVATQPSVTFRKCTSGVLPMHWVISLLTPLGSVIAMIVLSCSQNRERGEVHPS